ncbi:homoserine kinase [soil metagenome]
MVVIEASHVGGSFTVTVPASSANLGPGLDVLGVALGLHATAGVGHPPPGAGHVDQHHPAWRAFSDAGGVGELWVHAPIPMGRGLGYSGAVRVAGAVAALAATDHRLSGRLPPTVAAEVVRSTGALEGHVDNVAASVHGGVVVAVAEQTVPVPLGLVASVVVWIPDASTTSTDRSRAALPEMVPRADAVFNVGRVAMLVAALTSGSTDALGMATDDRLHQPSRLAAVPASAHALRVGREHGAWCGWLSGSGPSVAFLCDPSTAARLAARLPSDGHSKILPIDMEGTHVHRRA